MAWFALPEIYSLTITLTFSGTLVLESSPELLDPLSATPLTVGLKRLLGLDLIPILTTIKW